MRTQQSAQQSTRCCISMPRGCVIAPQPLSVKSPARHPIVPPSSYGERSSTICRAQTPQLPLQRRSLLLPAVFAAALSTLNPEAARAEGDTSGVGVFQELPSGLKFLDIRKGSGPTPKVGDQVTVHWAGFTAGYRQHRMDNTSIRDEPYRFTVGDPGTIKAFSEAVQLMGKGGLCRIEVPGELMEELAYPLRKDVRYLPNSQTFRVGPQPKEFGGSRSLDFVLDNKTFDRSPFNRTLVFDISLIGVTSSR